MKTIEVTSWIGSGAQHKVGKTLDGRLAKIPHLKGRIWDRSNAKTAAADVEILRQFKISIPDTQTVSRPQIEHDSTPIKAIYAIVTEEIRGRIFRELDLNNTDIKAQLTQITQSSLEIRKELGVAVDFLGGEAIYHFLNYLFHEKSPGQLGAYNLLIDQDDQIKLIDTNLLDPSRAPKSLRWLINAFIDLQHALLSNLLADPDLINKSRKENKYRSVGNLAKSMYQLSRRIEASRIALK